MARAYDDHDVQTVVNRFLASPIDGMVRLLAKALYGNWDRRSHRSIVNQAGLPNEVHELAYELVEAATAIANREHDERRYCRGAILELIAYGLLVRRSTDVRVEQQLGPFPDPPWDGGFSDPIDLVVVEPPLEIYECKSVARDFAGKHAETFRLAQELEAAAHCGIVTLDYREKLVDWLEGWRDCPPLYAYTYEDFLLLAEERARTQVA